MRHQISSFFFLDIRGVVLMQSLCQRRLIVDREADTSVRDVVGGRIVKHHAILRNNSNIRPQSGYLGFGYINAIDQDLSLFDVVEPVQEPHQRTLSSTRLANDTHGLSTLYFKTDIFHYVVILVPILERYISKFDTGFAYQKPNWIMRFLNRAICLHQIKHRFNIYPPHAETSPHPR
jgi:hypothetical protein